jgi:hypothetical protein
MAQKINNLAGIRETMAAVPSLTKVHITEDGRHYFDEGHAKAANGYDEAKDKQNKLQRTPKKVSYKTYEAGAKELEMPTPTPAAA